MRPINLLEPPYADPHVRWCERISAGRNSRSAAPPVSIRHGQDGGSVGWYMGAICIIRTQIIAVFKEGTSNGENEGHWVEASIRRVMDAGIMNGRDTGFAPNESIMRAEVAVVVDRILKQMGK
jgi:hypothetical protein